jgi:hypothetical protein
VREGERVRTVIQAPGTLGGPIAEGATVGKVRVFRGRQLVRSVPLVTADAVPKAGFLRRAWGLVLPVAMVGAGIALWVAVRRRRRAPDLPVRHPARAD